MGVLHITTKFPGGCIKCAGSIAAGEVVNWEDGKTWHITCPAQQLIEPASASEPGTIRRGSGYGGRPYTVGAIVRLSRQGDPDRFGVVVTATQVHIREDGLSYGVGGESGYVYRAEVRPATPEETAAEQARLAAIQAAAHLP